MKALRSWPVPLLLGAQLLLGLDALPHLSVTIDEFLHVPVGYLTWRTHDVQLDLQSAPLFRALCFGLPLSVSHPDIRLSPPRESDTAWGFSYRFMADNYRIYRALFVAPRLMVLACGLGLSLLVYFEARRRYGTAAGLCALTFSAFCPNLLAHGRLATLDMGVSLAFLVTLAAFTALRRHPGTPLTLALGLALGVAQVTKFTSLLLFPLLVFLALPGLPGEETRGRRLARLGAAFAVALLVIDAGYWFDRVGEPLSAFGFESRPLAALAKLLPSLPAPVPYSYLRGLDLQMVDREGYLSYFAGQLSRSGRWYYFMAAALFKMTLPALAACLAGLIIAMRRGDREGLLHLAAPALAIFTAFSLSDSKNIGFRYVLPALPLLYVLAGGLLRDWRETMPRRWRLIAVCVLFVHGLEALRVHPHPLAYFNALAGGARGGIYWLGDSNLDWGQDLPGLASYLESHGIPEVQLAYFGRVDPALYGIRYRLLRGRGEPGVAAVSASFLQGIPYVVLEEGGVQPADGGHVFREDALFRNGVGYYRWLLDRPPLAVIGGSIYLFRLP